MFFINNKLRIIAENCDFQERNQEEVNRITLNDELKQAIAGEEVITVIHVSVKEGNMTEV